MRIADKTQDNATPLLTGMPPLSIGILGLYFHASPLSKRTYQNGLISAIDFFLYKNYSDLLALLVRR
jgi:hypothetical protein